MARIRVASRFGYSVVEAALASANLALPLPAQGAAAHEQLSTRARSGLPNERLGADRLHDLGSPSRCSSACKVGVAAIERPASSDALPSAAGSKANEAASLAGFEHVDATKSQGVHDPGVALIEAEAPCDRQRDIARGYGALLGEQAKTVGLYLSVRPPAEETPAKCRSFQNEPALPKERTEPWICGSRREPRLKVGLGVEEGIRLGNDHCVLLVRFRC